MSDYSPLYGHSASGVLVPLAVDPASNGDGVLACSWYLFDGVSAMGRISASNPLPVTEVSGAAVLVQGSAAISAGSAGTCTLPASGSKFTYLRGFTMTSAPVVTPAGGIVSITGVPNTFTFQYENLAVGQSLLSQYFGESGLKSSAANTAIVINFPAIALGGATAINMWGYQL